MFIPSPPPPHFSKRTYGKVIQDTSNLYKGFTVEIIDEGDEYYCVTHPSLSKPSCVEKSCIEKLNNGNSSSSKKY
ncbi:MAG TPA: hypothetical protein PLI22_07210 [Caldisericia bacterium]|jgi:hypothetical protein|nr:hypothetical protein [Caldisericia bacterium]